jgi:glycosyltransferase involved in cell wall biosynthesis
MYNPISPVGGTELMYEELMKRLPSHLKDRYSIFNYIDNASFNKKTIYWCQLSYDQPAVQFLKNITNINLIDYFVFVSYWQFEKFRKIFDIPSSKSCIIKNAYIETNEKQLKTNDKIKICYTSTPWRGLNILLKSWEILQPKNCELHIFSSSKIYGENFASEDKQFEILYDNCRKLPNVVYRGIIPNEQLRKELNSFDILAYPNTFEETSCISVIEALSSGLRVITSSLGALPETTEGWAKIYPFEINEEIHIQKFTKILESEIEDFKNGKLKNHLENQIKIYKNKWSWDNRINEWLDFLNTVENTPKKSYIKTII